MVAQQALDYVGDETGPLRPASPDESMDRTLGLLDIMALAACLASDTGSTGVATYADEVDRRSTRAMERYGFCSCADLQLRPGHTQHHIEMARRFVQFAAMRAVLPGEPNGLEIAAACCDPATAASTVATEALCLSAETLGVSHGEVSRQLSVALSL